MRELLKTKARFAALTSVLTTISSLITRNPNF
jgi:hypothetical protein